MTVKTYGQSECRSIIGAHLKPVAQTPLSWAIEGIGAVGVMSDRTIAKWSLYGALDYSEKNHQLYFEGAYKDWYNPASNPDGAGRQTGLTGYNRPTPYHWGLRELFYRYGSRETFVKAGVQSLKTTDYILFDERMLGVSAAFNRNALTAAFDAGTVSQRIARFQSVCGTRHLYNLFHRSQYNFVGEDLGETNFAAVFLKWEPSKKQKAETKKGNADDEFETFESDEFMSVEGTQGKAVPKIEMKEGGLFFYEEFGSGFHEYKYYTGLFANVNLPADIILKTELIGQYILNDHALAWWGSLEKQATWSNGTSTVSDISYIGKIDITEGAHFYPAFSNRFLGEVMRLDVIDLPLIYGSVKHHFSGKWKPVAKLSGVLQLKGEHSKEVDFIAGVKLFGHARITAIGSYLSSELLDQDYWLIKLELRIAF